jgi:hypothetical protein
MYIYVYIYLYIYLYIYMGYGGHQMRLKCAQVHLLPVAQSAQKGSRTPELANPQLSLEVGRESRSDCKLWLLGLPQV